LLPLNLNSVVEKYSKNEISGYAKVPATGDKYLKNSLNIGYLSGLAKLQGYLGF